MKLSRLQAGLAGALLAAVHGGAQAIDIDAITSFHDLRLAVTDLAPGDAAAARIDIAQTDGTVSTYAYDGVSAQGDYKSFTFANLDPIDASSTQGGVQSAVHGSGTLASLLSSASVSSNQQGTGGITNAYTSYMVTVAAHTAFTISGQLSLALDLAGAANAAWGQSYGAFSLDDLDNAAGTHGNGSFSARLKLHPDQLPAPFAPTDFSYTFTNDTDGVLHAGIAFTTFNYVTVFDPTVPSPVPEPGSSGMLGAGLLLLAAARRLRPRLRP